MNGWNIFETTYLRPLRLEHQNSNVKIGFEHPLIQIVNKQYSKLTPFEFNKYCCNITAICRTLYEKQPDIEQLSSEVTDRKLKKVIEHMYYVYVKEY
jgi:hypothetical protein